MRALVCIWPHRVETPPDLILACKPGKISPSRSQTINHVGRHLIVLFHCGVTSIRDSRLFLLQKLGSLWSRNGWVSAIFKLLCSCFLIAFFSSTINAPSTGNTYDAFLAAAKALGSNETPVGCSLVPRAFHVLITTRTIFSFPTPAR